MIDNHFKNIGWTNEEPDFAKITLTKKDLKELSDLPIEQITNKDDLFKWIKIKNTYPQGRKTKRILASVWPKNRSTEYDYPDEQIKVRISKKLKEFSIGNVSLPLSKMIDFEVINEAENIIKMMDNLGYFAEVQLTVINLSPRSLEWIQTIRKFTGLTIQKIINMAIYTSRQNHFYLKSFEQVKYATNLINYEG